MIVLTQLHCLTPIFVSPDAITSTGTYLDDDDDMTTYVTYGRNYRQDIIESEMDVARLRAAWEQRFNARELHGTLPIAVGMAEYEDGPGIKFTCCAITHREKLKKVAAKAAKGNIFSRIFGRGQ